MDGVQHFIISLPPLEDSIRRDDHRGGLHNRATNEPSSNSFLYGYIPSTPITGHSGDGDPQASHHQLKSEENELRQLHAKWDESHVCGSYIGKPINKDSASISRKPQLNEPSPISVSNSRTDPGTVVASNPITEGMDIVFEFTGMWRWLSWSP